MVDVKHSVAVALDCERGAAFSGCQFIKCAQPESQIVTLQGPVQRDGTICGLEYFGVDHVLFASDSPFDPEQGPMYIRETIKIIDSLDISDDDRDAIYQGNTTKLLKLPAN